MNVDIKEYLLNNLHFISDYKIKHDYKYIKKYYKNIKNLVEKNLIQKNMIGGNPEKISNSTEKMETIKKLVEVQNELENELPNMKEKIKGIIDKTNILINKIENIDISNFNKQKFNKEDFVKTMVSLEDSNLSDLTNINTAEFKESINYYTKVPDYGEFKNSNYIESIISEFNKKIKLASENKYDSKENEKFSNDINKFIENLNKTKIRLQNEIKEMKIKINDYNKMIKYDIESEIKNKNIVMINKSNMVGSKTKTTRNKMLQLIAVGGKIDTINMMVKMLTQNKKGGEIKNEDKKINPKNNNLQEKILSIKKEYENLKKIIERHKYFIEKINLINKYETGHINYLLSISSNKFFQGERYEFRYIEKNDLNRYSSIIDDILKINYQKKNNDTDSEIPDFIFSRDLITLKKIKEFLATVNQKMNSGQVISVDECNDDSETRHRLILLNNYANILDDFKAKKLNKITMYARINDIKELVLPTDADFMKKKLFMSDIEYSMYLEKKGEKGYVADAKKLIINPNSCQGIKPNEEEEKLIKDGIRFTEVFDSMQYQFNETLANHMGLNALLTMKQKENQKNGIILVTYGYSGTGKTFTLFGKDESNPGILQSTLKTIKNLDKVYFRLYELYGHGLSYPHYWEQGVDGISHKIFKYSLDSSAQDLIIKKVETIECKNKTKTNENNEIFKFVNDYNKNKESYKTIEGKNVENVFKNFSNFMDVIEHFREDRCQSENEVTVCKINNIEHNFISNIEEHEERRIRDTNNNIVSSRSILVYDFIIAYKEDGIEKTAPFIIIDLPGREEIIQTYISPYFDLSNNNSKSGDIIAELYLKGNKSFTGNINKKMLELKFLFSSMAINPIGLALFNPEDIIKNFFNDKHKKNEKKQFLESPIETKYELTGTISEIEERNNPDKDRLKTQMFNNTNYITKMKDGTNERGFYFLEEIINYKGGSFKFFCEIDNDYNLQLKKMQPKLFGYETDMQKYGLICIHLINRMLVLNKFDMLHELYIYIVNKYLNNILFDGIDKLSDTEANNYLKKLEETNFKRQFIFNKRKENKASKELLKDIIEYNYYLTPLEGIYINENISGIVKYLSTNEKLIVTKGLSQEKITEKINSVIQEYTSNQQTAIQKFKQLLNDMEILDNSVQLSETETTQTFKIKESQIMSILKNIYDSSNKNDSIQKLSIELFQKQKKNELNKMEEKLDYMKQDTKLDFQTQQKIVRMWLTTTVKKKDSEEILKGEEKNKVIKSFFKTDEVRPSILEIKENNVNYNHDSLSSELEKMNTVYQSDKIFKFKETLIQDILKPYLNDISDFKVIYLFGNYKEDDTRMLKCQPQIKLLKNTQGFINNIVESKLIEDNKESYVNFEEESYYQNEEIDVK